MWKLSHDDGELHIVAGRANRWRLEAVSFRGQPIPYNHWQTAYPNELIRDIFTVRGPAFVCDEIAREEDAAYVAQRLEHDITAYVPLSWFSGKRVLDFGCGAGASTIILGRMFPDSTVVGVELFEQNIRIAEMRRAHYGMNHIAFATSPSGTELPDRVGVFDCIVLNAVWEHLLPHERIELLPRLWSVLRPRGICFLNETPYRWFPIESHTTGLPLINYLPAPVAQFFATRCSRRVNRYDSWQDLLRKGIRGGSEREILRILRGTGAYLMDPRNGDRIDLWFATSTGQRMHPVKRPLRALLKILRSTTGQTIVPYLSLAIARPA